MLSMVPLLAEDTKSRVSVDEPLHHSELQDTAGRRNTPAGSSGQIQGSFDTGFGHHVEGSDDEGAVVHGAFNRGHWVDSNLLGVPNTTIVL